MNRDIRLKLHEIEWYIIYYNPNDSDRLVNERCKLSIHKALLKIDIQKSKNDAMFFDFHFQNITCAI